MVVRFARLDDGSLAFSSCLTGGTTVVLVATRLAG